MKIRILPALALSLALGAVAYAQDSNANPLAQQDAGTPPGAWQGHGHHGARDQRGHGGVMGTVTEAAADHFTIKSMGGQTVTVHFTDSTRILKQNAAPRGEQAGPGGNPPETIKASDIKVGDAIEVRGRVNQESSSVDAMAIVQLNAARARQIEQMEANFGKTLLMGKVTAIEGARITIQGPDNAAHTFVADENTSFRKRRDSITLADIHVGDTVRADGAVKDGTFTATTVNVMGMPAGGPHGQHNAPPPPPPPANPPSQQ